MSFVSFISCYDFVCLVETFIDSFTSTLFLSFISFVTPVKKTFPSRKMWRGYHSCEKCTDALCKTNRGWLWQCYHFGGVQRTSWYRCKCICDQYLPEPPQTAHFMIHAIMITVLQWWNCVCLVFWKRMTMLLLFYVAIWTLKRGVRFRPILTLLRRVLKRLEVIFGWTTTQVMICLPNAAQEIFKKMNRGKIYWYCAQVLIYVFWTEHVMVTRMVSTRTYLLLVIVLLTTLYFSLSRFSTESNASVGKNWFQTHASCTFFALPKTAKFLQRSSCYIV